MKNYNKSATIQDRKVYAAGEEIPDLSSWECVDNSNGKHTYWGLSADVSKLPTYCPTGSKALCLDTGDAYLWHGGTRQWYAFGSTPPSSGGGDVDLNSLDWDDVAAYEGVLFEATIEKSQLFIGDSTADASFQPTPLISGETYNVHFNGVDYKNLTCKESDNCLYIGNEQLLIPWGTLSSEPFVVCYYSKDRYSAIRIDNLELESFDFSLEGKSYVLIPDKYTPLGDWVQRGSEYCSIMIGEENTASGRYSYAEGFYNTASGDYSHAENTNTIASGEAAHAEGSGTKAEGGSSHAEGNGTKAEGVSSHAEGENASASGRGAHAEGYYTIASGEYSHAEGGYDPYAPSSEYPTVASGNSSHAEGFNATASGDYSHAEGNGTKAEGDISHAEGFMTTASGDYSHAEGRETIAASYTQHVEGSHNIEDTEHKYLHIIGNGNYSKRSNAHTVDHKGNAWYAADVYVGGTSQDDASKLATEDFVKEYLGVIENGTY